MTSFPGVGRRSGELIYITSSTDLSREALFYRGMTICLFHYIGVIVSIMVFSHQYYASPVVGFLGHFLGAANPA